MRILVPGALLLTACFFDPSTNRSAVATDADPNAPDADLSAPDADLNAPDADPSAPDAAPCPNWALTPAFFTPCTDIGEESASLILNTAGEYTIDTSNGMLLPPDGLSPIYVGGILGNTPGSPRVISAGYFEIAQNSSLRATGNRPLLIVSWGDMLISGDIDVSTPNIDKIGAGGSPPACGQSAGMNGTPNEHGGGGGGGGAFGARGGAGGTGRIDQDPGNSPGGPGGIAKTAVFHGGCAGGHGGLGDNSVVLADRGARGEGGGAVYLSARSNLTVSGVINAGGMGGGGAQDSRSGGGGGGSGGLVGLEAASLSFQSGSRLVANGGGGGGGSNRMSSLPGEDGRSDDTEAAGGIGENTEGGAGGVVDDAVGKPGESNDRGGGGGGGGVGHIIVRSNNTPGDPADVVSPAQQSTTIALP